MTLSRKKVATDEPALFDLGGLNVDVLNQLKEYRIYKAISTKLPSAGTGRPREPARVQQKQSSVRTAGSESGIHGRRAEKRTEKAATHERQQIGEARQARESSDGPTQQRRATNTVTEAAGTPARPRTARTETKRERKTEKPRKM